MAYRIIRKEEDPILRKKSKKVTQFDEKLEALLNDMADTMYKEEGVGLAAVQIGILKRIFITDVGNGLIEYINPEIISVSGEQCGDEGCLSVPGKYGQVTRPNEVVVRAQNRTGEWFELRASEFLARAVLHENDHLNGKLFVDLVQGELYTPAEED